MKKTLKYISIPLTAATIALISAVIPYAYAQDVGNVQAQLTIQEAGCIWTGGDPGDPDASLRVYDGETCIISTDGWEALNVQVDDDVAYGGGTLIIGSDSDDVTFTVNNLIDNQGGTITVGNGTAHTYDAILATTSANLEIDGGGTLTTVANSSTGDNSIKIDGDIYVGTSGSPTGTLNLNDPVTGAANNTATNINVYGDLNVLAGIEVDISNKTSVYSGSTADTAGDYTTYYLWVGRVSVFDGGTFTNTGIVNVTYNSLEAMWIYKGTVINDNPSDNFTTFACASGIIIQGTSSAPATLQNNGIFTSAGSLAIYEYAHLDLNTGTYSQFIIANGYSVNAKGDASGNIGEIDIQSGATLSTSGIVLGSSPGGNGFVGKLTNNGTIDRLDNPALGTSILLWTDSIVDNFGTFNLEDDSIYVYGTSVFTNKSGAAITSDTGSAVVYDSGTFTQEGTMTVKYLYIGGLDDIGGGIFNAKNLSATNIKTHLYIGDSDSTGGTMTIDSGAQVTMTDANANVKVEHEGVLTGNGQLDYTSTTATVFSVFDGGTVTLSDTSNAYQLGSIEIQSPWGDGVSTFLTSPNVNAEINSYHGFCADGAVDYYCSIEIGTDESSTGSSLMSVNGPLTVANNVGSDVHIIVGSNGTDDKGKLIVANGITMTVLETSGQFYVRSDDLYGLYVRGTLTLTNGSSHMAMNNEGGKIKVFRNEGVLAASLITGKYTQSSTLEIENGESMTVNGSADITGDSYVDGFSSPGGSLTTTKCAIIRSGGTLDIKGTTATLDVNTANLADCDTYLTGRASSDGFVVLGTFTTEAGSDTDIWRNLIVDAGLIGGSTDTYSLGDINVTGDVLNNTTGIIYIGDVLNATGTYTQQADSDAEFYESDAGDVDFGGTAYFDGYAEIGADGGTGGTFDCTNTLTIDNDSEIYVYKNATVTVNGATAQTIVNGIVTTTELTLDGTLNSGDLTVNSNGKISSGSYFDNADGNQPSEFLINADNLTVNTGGLISSDAVSLYGNQTDGLPGSYGGEGTKRGTDTGGTTYGPVKFTWSEIADWSDSPYYGERGKSANGTNGGGAVRIKATGNILINGTISANGGSNTLNGPATGAGGTVILIHDIDHTDTTATFTGNGTISANGGDSSSDGGGLAAGGGGRIVIDSILFDKPGSDYGFTGTLSASGGYAYKLPGPSHYAAAGTIVLLGDDNSPNGTLIVDQTTSKDGPYDTETYLPETYITTTGPDYIFDRIEAANEAVVRFATAPGTNPISCYEHVGNEQGHVYNTTTACASLARDDKPDTMYINTSIEGAGSEFEPSVSAPLTVADSTPVISAIYRNPDTSGSTPTADKIEIQVVDDIADFAAGPYLWNYSGTITDRSAGTLEVGERSADVEYNTDDTGTDLSSLPTYYIRVRFSDSAGTSDGLWTHRDMGNHYNFDVDEYMLISNDCSDALAITDPNAPVHAIRDVPGDRYGTDSCNIEISSTYSDWQVLFGKQNGEEALGEAFDDNGGNYIHEIDNAGTTDCEMDTTGANETPPNPEEEYGFNLTTTPGLIQSNIQENTDCSQDYNASGYMFNVEDFGSEDAVIMVTDDPINEESFGINMHVSVNSDTVVSVYTLGISTILTIIP